MESKKFINVLKKHTYTLIAVPLFVGAIVFALVKDLPDTYTSKATLSAGFADQSQQLLADKENLQQDKTTQQFSNLIQIMHMKNVFDQVSYQLILHDLTSNKPYRKPSKLIGYLNPDARRHAIEVYTRLYNSMQPLSLSDDDQKGLNQVIASMKYDYASLTKQVKIYRIENSDFISVEFESESPVLSEVVVNTLCNEFIDYYTKFTRDNEQNSIDFLNNLLTAKKDSLDQSMHALRDFKIQNHVLNLDDQAKTLYTQIADYESKLEIVKKDIEANAGALRSIDDKFNVNDKQYLESKLALINQDILNTKQQLNDLNDKYIKSNFDTGFLNKINAQKKLLSLQINQATDKYDLGLLNTKQDLITQKLNLEVNQELAKNSIGSIQDELYRLNRKFDMMVPNVAVEQADEGNVNVASQEYLDILKKYNESNLQYNGSARLKPVEWAQMGELQPSVKVLLVVISGFASLIFCLLVLFILFYLDNSIQTPVELAAKTNIPVLGYLPVLKNIALLDVKQLWNNDEAYPEANEFKTQLRSARFEIDNALNGSAVLNISSLSGNEGKTILAMTLAGAYTMTGKKVLLIDGNFENPSITEIAKPDYFIEDFLTGETAIPYFTGENEVFILGNKGMDKSLFEIAGESSINEKMHELKRQFDIVLIESPALDMLNKAKEWDKVADKILGVFESGTTLTDDEKQEVQYLQTINGKFIGWIMNKLPRKK